MATIESTITLDRPVEADMKKLKAILEGA